VLPSAVNFADNFAHFLGCALYFVDCNGKLPADRYEGRETVPALAVSTREEGAARGRPRCSGCCC